jgi:hypothetical protein
LEKQILTGFIVNREAADQMGMKDPIGKEMQMWDRKGKIVGLIHDFHFGSVQDSTKPLVLLFMQQVGDGHILVRLNPAFPFTYQFSDDAYRKLYASEAVIRTLSNYFAFLATELRRSCFATLLPRS